MIHINDLCLLYTIKICLFHSKTGAKLTLIGFPSLVFAMVTISFGGALVSEVYEPPLPSLKDNRGSSLGNRTVLVAVEDCTCTEQPPDYNVHNVEMTENGGISTTKMIFLLYFGIYSGFCSGHLIHI